MDMGKEGGKMTGGFVNRRGIVMAAAAFLLSGCAIIPRGADVPIGNAPEPTPTPTDTTVAQDAFHRVALLVPLSGQNGDVGQSLANATTMALLDTEATNLRITTYDTATGARDAARRALSDGNGLILGPLLGSNVAAVRAETAPTSVPVITFSNDTGAAGPGVFVMGHIPEQSIARSVEYVRESGGRTFAILAPDGEYGDRAETALRSALDRFGGTLTARERYARTNTSVVSSAQRLGQRGGFDTLVIADGASGSIRAANALGSDRLRIVGTDRWSGDRDVLAATSLRGAVYAAVSDGRYGGFVRSYSDRFGGQPYRVSTLGYDAVLLSLRAARDWSFGLPFPTQALYDSAGFDGVDGPFRFQRNGVALRALEVRRVGDGTMTVVSAAPDGGL